MTRRDVTCIKGRRDGDVRDNATLVCGTSIYFERNAAKQPAKLQSQRAESSWPAEDPFPSFFGPVHIYQRLEEHLVHTEPLCADTAANKTYLSTFVNTLDHNSTSYRGFTALFNGYRDLTVNQRYRKTVESGIRDDFPQLNVILIQHSLHSLSCDPFNLKLSNTVVYVSNEVKYNFAQFSNVCNVSMSDTSETTIAFFESALPLKHSKDEMQRTGNRCLVRKFRCD